MSEQEENLERVTARIGSAIQRFFLIKGEGGNREFFVEDLRRYVISEVGIIAPASPDRIMRNLRQKGIINYTVLSRSESYYRIEPWTQKTPQS